MYESQYNRISEFTNARNQLRADSDIEQLVLKVIATLPEDSSRDFARESFQFGAGYGYLAPEHALEDEIFICDETGQEHVRTDVIRAFFDTIPRNRQIAPELAAKYEQEIARLVAQMYAGQPVRPLHPAIDMYQFEAFVAFVEGYRVVTHHRRGRE